MRKDNNTRIVPARRREPDFDEPIRRWSTLPISVERASELVDAFTRYDDGEMIDALIQLICGLAPPPTTDEQEDLDSRRLAGTAALERAFAYTRRAHNELGAYVVNLRCAEWE